ncbi:hypothetical protein ILUMI_12580 [Ignelater luminosus]|uniref:Rab proteins geranylgeranyltransferase component A n=1 Tax=Ignelater luminosus TaxID=2038154 RepID=A0A8K0GCT5_IGNLU|nr:hypothetical protein ILUMI_12580 [Ignelater luminosus]
MDYELPSEFDLIVVGTGMIESIVAAAASRIGKRVLHIDSNNYYGGLWASFNLDSISNILNSASNIETNLEVKQFLTENEKIYQFGNDAFHMHTHSQIWHIPEKANEQTETEQSDLPTECIQKEEESWTQEKLLKNSRKFNIDIAPKLHFARGDFVELLISSNIARYSEFRSVSRVLTWLNGQLEVVPCSRSDVFSSTKVSVIEKRMLMKLLTSCVDGDEKEFVGYENKTFRTYLKDRKLTDNLIHYVLYAIAMATDTTPCLEGVENTKRFLSSLGRFGKTPFLYSMYGSGEITQAFCRLSAVFGGVYALSQPLNGLIFNNENKFKSLLCGQQRISAEHLVMGIEKLPKEFVNFTATQFISRAVFVIDRSIMASEKENLTLLLFPPEDGKNPCTMIEVGPLTGTCPKDTYIVHMFTKQTTNPEEDFKHCVERLFGNSKNESETGEKENLLPNVLWSFYYTVPNTVNLDLKNGIPKNIFVCPGPDLDLDYDPAIAQAKAIFNEIYPDLEFLPRAPDPEEIIIEGEDNNNIVTEGENLTDQPIDEATEAVADLQIETSNDHGEGSSGIEQGEAE